MCEGKKYQDKVKLKTCPFFNFCTIGYKTVKAAKKSQTLLLSVIINVNVTEAEMFCIIITLLMHSLTQSCDGKTLSLYFYQIVKLQDLFGWGKQNVAIRLPLVLLLT